LRRNPGEPPDKGLDGYTFWQNRFAQLGDAGKSEIIKAFIESSEYRARFCLTEQQ
jgi:hypothetical protein